MASARVPPLGLALFLALTASRPTLAWESSTHVSIVRAAFRLSPAAQARVPEAYREKFFEGVAGAERNEVDCARHVGALARMDVAGRADGLLADLRSASPGESAYARARVLGSYLHYVADCAAPASRASGYKGGDSDFFVNKDFVLYRQKQDLTGPLGAALRARGSEARWGEDDTGADSAVFRLVVNLTVDALLLLPGPAESDSALVIFLVNRMDNGFANDRISWRYWYQHVPAIGDRQPGREGAGRPDLLTLRAVQVVEWSRQSRGSTAHVRALLYNGAEACARASALRTPRWSVPMPPSEMPPGSLLALEIDTPAELRLADVAVAWERAECASSASRPGLIGTQRRLVLEAVRSPRFEGDVTDWKPEPASPPGRTRTQAPGRHGP